MGLELATSVSSDDGWRAKVRDPCGDKSLGNSLGGTVSNGYRGLHK